MKTNVLMKIAVVFMAAFGAYAFSANSEPLNEFSYKKGEEQICTMIEAGCSVVGLYDCKVVINNSIHQILGTNCVEAIKHNSPNPVDWR